MTLKPILVIAFLLGVMIRTGESASMDVPLFYSAKETRARIVDEETGQPIEGAVVVAQWILASIPERGPTLHIAEAVTDKNGEFVIPAWGPKPRRPLTVLKYLSPELIIFKHGYQPLWLHNESLKDVVEYFPNYKNMKTKDLRNGAAWYNGNPTESVQESMWNGLNIQIEKFNGTSDRWLERMVEFLRFIREEDDKQLRQLFTALAAERAYLKEKPVSQQRRTWLLDFSDRIDRALK